MSSDPVSRSQGLTVRLQGILDFGEFGAEACSGAVRAERGPEGTMRHAAVRCFLAKKIARKRGS